MTACSLGAASSSRALAQDPSVHTERESARPRYDRLLAQGNASRDAGDCRHALSIYEQAYTLGAAAIAQRRFGSVPVTITLDIRRHRTRTLDVPVREDVMRPLFKSAARCSLTLDQPDEVLRWLRLHDDSLRSPYDGAERVPYPKHLSAVAPLTWGGRAWLRELVPEARDQGALEVERALTELDRDLDARDTFRSNHWARVLREQRDKLLAVALSGLALISLGLLLYRINFFHPRSSRLHGRRYKFTRRLRAQPHAQEPRGAHDLWMRALALSCVLLFWGFSLLFFNLSWKKPQDTFSLSLGVCWAFFALGAVSLLFGLFGARRSSLTPHAHTALLHDSSPQNLATLLALLARWDTHQRALNQLLQVPGTIRRRHTFTAFEQLATQHIDTPRVSARARATLALWLALTLHRRRHHIPDLLMTWIEQGMEDEQCNPHLGKLIHEHIGRLRDPWRSQLEALLWRHTSSTQSAHELTLHMQAGTRWTLAAWRAYIAHSPRFYPESHAVIWGVYAWNGALKATFRMDEDGALLDARAEDVRIKPGPGERIGVVHRTQLTHLKALSWAEHLADFEIISHTEQLTRERATLSPDGQHLCLPLPPSFKGVPAAYLAARHGEPMIRLPLPMHACVAQVAPGESLVEILDEHAQPRRAQELHEVARAEIIYALLRLGADDAQQ